MLWLTDLRSRTPTERRIFNRYAIEFIAAMLLYSILLVASVTILRHHELHGILKYIIAVMPAFGGFAITAAIVRLGLRLDELQRRTFVDAGALAAVITIAVTMTLGFLENAGISRVSMMYVTPIMVAAWGISLPFLRRRYR